MVKVIITNINHVNIIKNDDITICVNSLKHIFPELSDEIKERITISYDERKSMFNEEFCDEFNLIHVDKLIEYINSTPKDIFVMKYSDNLIEEMNDLLPQCYSVDLSNLSKEQEYSLLSGNIRSDLKFIDKYNNHKAKSSSEILNAFLKISSKKDFVDKYNLTTLEKIIFVADQIRKRPYKKSEDETSPNISRDITDVLDEDNDYIVCDGYAKLFSSIMNELGIYCEKINLLKPYSNYGHATNIIYINDDYYDIHDFFIVDLTSFNISNDPELLHYNFFIPINAAEREFINKGYSPISNLDFYNSHSIFCNIKESLERLNIFKMLGSKISEPLLREYGILAKNMEELSIKINDEKLYELSCECKESTTDTIKSMKGEKLVEVYSNFHDSTIDSGSLFNAIYQVRRLEYLLDCNIYNLNEDIIRKIYDNSIYLYNSFLHKLFYNSFLDSAIQKNVSNLSDEKSSELIKKDIKRLDLLRFLKNELRIKEEQEKNKVKEKVSC